MASKVFLQALQNKLKGGSSRSIHLNALPGRLATRLDLKQLDLVGKDLSAKFLTTILTKQSFEFKISFDNVDLNELSLDEQKRLGLIAKRMNSIIIENDDYYKEHGVKTLGFGYPILIKRSTKDPDKVIKAPLFIWPLEAVKSRNKVNEWSILRNKIVNASGQFVEADIHSVAINEVLLSFIKGEDDITLPTLSAEALEDAVIDEQELIQACATVLDALNTGGIADYQSTLQEKFKIPMSWLPDSAGVESIANNKAYIHFGGVLGLFRAQKESIITDIAKLIERYDQFQFENLTIENLSDTTFSAVDTDPAQQAIIHALGRETNQIIQGPPGTGKSQSLTALITNALANGLKALVVCEKKTALDVIKRNIERTNPQMAQLVAVIDDVNDDREAIVDSVRDRQSLVPNHQQVERVRSRYMLAGEKLNEITQTINLQHQSLAVTILKGQTWDQIVGRYLSLRKKYSDVPLKSILDIKDFKFVNDQDELIAILRYLSRADNLYHQSSESHPDFNTLSDLLFTKQTVGEARAKIEAFCSGVTKMAPKINEVIDELTKAHVLWIDTFYSSLPDPIKAEFDSYLPFLAGEKLTTVELSEFRIEKSIQELIAELDQLLNQAKHLRNKYELDLNINYNNYRTQVNDALKSYLEFVNGQVSTYGQFILNNSKGARLKTQIFGLFSRRYKEIGVGREQIVEKIAEVRTAHLQKSYVIHQYNDGTPQDDLSVYINNLHELKNKLDSWAASIPDEVNRYLASISEYHIHEDLNGIKTELKRLLEGHTNARQELELKHRLLDPASINELNALIAYIPELILKLKDIHGFYPSFRMHLGGRQESYRQLGDHFSTLAILDGLQVCEGLDLTFDSLSQAVNCCELALKVANGLNIKLHGFRQYYDWRAYYLNLDQKVRHLVDQLALNVENDWEQAFECWYLFWVLSFHEPENLPKDDYDLQQFVRLKEEFNSAQLENVASQWKDRQLSSVRLFKSKGNAINSLFNKKGAKGMRRNSLRTIIRSEFNLFTDFFPVVLLNPSVCSSIIPLEEGIFDLVIFDEASQLRLEDTYASLVRGKAKIVSGDKHQMAPSSYFEGSGAQLDPIEGDEEADEDNDIEVSQQRSHLNLADSESLLAFAVDRGFKESYLTVHYRSRHPFLIDFSNHAFYGKRLIPVPASKAYVPIEFIQVDGIYDNQVNVTEAKSVITILSERIAEREDGSYPTVGVATFNIYQRNLIFEEIAEARRLSPNFDVLMNKLGDSFFVKNLENIQGDERDIIIISTTFGRKTNGTFSQNFGPIIQGKGHRMLNVIITRAKDKVILCTSFPHEYTGQYAQLIQEKGNKGRAVLYAYLNYARAVSEQNSVQRESILNLLSEYCVDQQYDLSHPGLGSESIFEDEVFARLAQHIGYERIEQQHQVGGFRIDMIVKPKIPGRPIIAIECDGAKYHSSAEAYAWDIFRQQQLERFGFKFHRIWSTNWWDSADLELEKLLEFIRTNEE